MSWPEMPLSELLEPRQERPTDDEMVSGRLRIVSKISFADGSILFRSDHETKTPMIIVQPGDLLVSGINAYKGAIALYPVDAPGPATATIHYSAYGIRPDRAEPAYLWRLLRSDVFRERLERAVPGGIKTELKASRLLPVSVPLPPLDEQRRVICRLEAITAKISEVDASRQAAMTAASRLLASKTAQVFVQGQGRGWPQSRLGDFVVEAKYGTSEKAGDDSTGTPVLRMGNIQDGSLVLNELKYLDLTPQERGRLFLEKGDILVNRTNSAELVGKCAVFDVEGDYTFASYLIRLRVDQNRANPRFLARFINSPLGRSYMFAERKQMTGQANVNSKILLDLPIALPQLEEQGEKERELAVLEERVGAVRTLQESTKNQIEALTKSLVDKAFKGDL